MFKIINQNCLISEYGKEVRTDLWPESIIPRGLSCKESHRNAVVQLKIPSLGYESVFDPGEQEDQFKLSRMSHQQNFVQYHCMSDAIKQKWVHL
ncbi:hypothetical protein Ciccas_004328 [Cichlidogyrus casuarinus]|uniref:Uncharacterized protein n=1 Tax=Cichlidogyrus casuarinus TaxID=1844966 RepID=A0ABD2QCN5_9PLAT